MNETDKAIATYYPNLKTAYSKNQTVGRETVLHEFFHHLTNCKVVVVNKADEEYYADKYAQTFMQRVRSIRT